VLSREIHIAIPLLLMQRMTQFPVILLNDLAVTWWRIQATLAVKRIVSLVNGRWTLPKKCGSSFLVRSGNDFELILDGSQCNVGHTAI